MSEAHPPRRRVALWTLVGVLVLAAALRAYRLGSWPFEQDELYTIRDALNYWENVSNLRPLYYFLQHLLLQVVPPEPLAVRALPFLFGVAGVYATWLLARAVFGNLAGLVSAALVAFSAWHLYASQFARYWTLVYLLAVVAYLVLYRVRGAGRPGLHLAMVGILLAGALTHPSFAFPMVGAVLGAQLVSSSGPVRIIMPSRTALKFFWLPVIGLGALGLAFLLATGSFGGLKGTRGLSAGLRLLPAMVQWLSPVVVTAALLAWVYLAVSERDRIWAAMSAAGAVTGVGLLMRASFWTIAYADYAMAVTPLVYVTIGGGVQRLAEGLPSRRTAFAAAATLVLLAGVAPSVASHLSNGTRFDYGPAYAHVQRVDPAGLVMGWPTVMQRYYAPELRFRSLEPSRELLRETLRETGGFWLVASFRRYGMIRGGEAVERWMAANCRRVLSTQRPRFDYRVYRIELHRCDGPVSVTEAITAGTGAAL